MKNFRFQTKGDTSFGEYEQTQLVCVNKFGVKPINFELKTPDGAGVIISGIYNHPVNKGSGWLIGISVIDTNKPVRDWVFSMMPSFNGNDSSLLIVAPNDAELTLMD